MRREDRVRSHDRCHRVGPPWRQAFKAAVRAQRVEPRLHSQILQLHLQGFLNWSDDVRRWT